MEDQPYDAELVEEVLRSEGINCAIYRVETREDFEAALEQGHYDLIFSDKTLPSYDGMSALALARERRPEVPIVFVSGTLGEEVVIEALKHGATDYVLKQRLNRLAPVTRRALYEAGERRKREKAEEAQRKSEEQVRLLLDSTAEGIYGLDLEGTTTFANAACARLLGYSDPSELVGRNMHSIKHHTKVDGSPYPLEECRIYQAFRQGEGTHVDDEVLWRADGTSFPTEYWSYPVRHDGHVVGAVVTFIDISDRKRAEETLRASEAKYRELVEQAADAIVIFDSSLTLREVNSAACAMLSYAREELVGCHVSKLITAEDVSRLPLVLEGLRAGKTFRNERTLLRSDGTEVLVETSTKMLDGGWIQTIARDITERREAEQALQRHALTFETIHDAILFIDTQGRIIDCNLAAQATSGFSREELLGSETTLLHPPGESGAMRAEIASHLDNEGRWSGERVFVRKDGTTGVAETVLVLMRDTDGEPYSVLSVSRDITERKKAEEALRASEERFRSVFENTLDAIFILDMSGRFLEVIPAAERLTGLSREELLQLTYEDFQSRTEIAGLTSLWREFLERGEGTGEISFMSADGQVRDVEYHGTTDFIPGNHLAVVHDITERKKAEEARLAREAAEQSNLAKSEFLSRMSHELRTPLNSVIGFSQLLQMGELSQKQSQNVNYILKAGEHLLNLINDVLDIARIESGRSGISLEPVEVAATLRECLELIEPMAAQRQISINMGDSLEETRYVMADAQRLRQVLLNIMTNAVKYNKHQGSISLSCEQLGNRLRINVSDTGPGIAPGKLAKMFTPFERLGAEQTGVEGTGLGLALCKHLMEVMHGTIGVMSRMGEGTTLWVEFGISENPAQLKQLRTTPLVEALNYHTPRTVLYVEDNLSNLKLIEAVVATVPGVRLLTAMQGTLGLEVARQHRPDLILLDLHLPDLNGDVVLRRLQEDPRTNPIPVVVISADATQSQINKLLAAGAREYITKPVSVRTFLRMLERVLSDDPVDQT